MGFWRFYCVIWFGGFRLNWLRPNLRGFGFVRVFQLLLWGSAAVMSSHHLHGLRHPLLLIVNCPFGSFAHFKRVVEYCCFICEAFSWLNAMGDCQYGWRIVISALNYAFLQMIVNIPLIGAKRLRAVNRNLNDMTVGICWSVMWLCFHCVCCCHQRRSRRGTRTPDFWLRAECTYYLSYVFIKYCTITSPYADLVFFCRCLTLNYLLLSLCLIICVLQPRLMGRRL